MKTKKDIKILRNAGWTWLEIKHIDNNDMEKIRGSLFYNTSRLDLALSQIWNDIKEAFRRIFK